VRELLLHAMVLTVFVEGVTAGPVTPGRVMAALVALVVVFTLAARPSTPAFPHPWVAVPAVLLATWVVLTGIWTVSIEGWLEVVLELALAMALFVGYCVLVDSRALVRRLLVSFAVGATLVAPIGIWQFAQAERAVGLQGDPNTYALYQVAAVPVAVLLAVRHPGIARAWWSSAAVLLVASVISSQSRGAALGLLVVVAWLLWTGGEAWISHRARMRLAAAGGLLVAGGAVLAVTLLPRFDVAETLDDGGTGRLDIWRSAWGAWWEQPWGLGAGGFEEESGRLLSQTPGVGLDPYSVLFDGIKVHSAYLEPLVDLGPVGLVLFVALLVGTGLLLASDRETQPFQVTAALLPMLLAFVTAATFLSVLNNKLLWMLAGFAAVLPYLPERPPERPVRRPPVRPPDLYIDLSLDPAPSAPSRGTL
jgi:O-antigen ligase